MNLFRSGDFTLASGQKSSFKICCEALTSEDWETLAALAAERMFPFGEVEGVPRGGLPLAEALMQHRTLGLLLLVDDVYTSGASMERQRAGRPARGLVVFARKPITQSWITALFQLTPGAS